MRQKYLGDSYDIVKRFWAESLRSIAPLYAHARFVPSEIRVEYTSATTIPVDTFPSGPFGIFLDPHTGIPLPIESSQQVTASHVPLSFIVELNEVFGPRYLICFDQSYHRRYSLTPNEQREKKREYLRDHELNSFYYVSHAPFLFVSREAEVLDAIRVKLSSLGVPPRRFVPAEKSGSIL